MNIDIPEKRRGPETKLETKIAPQPDHPGQASFLGEQPPSRSKAMLNVSAVRSNPRGDGVPPMGEVYKTRSQDLAMLNRSMGKVPMSSKKLQQSTVTPTNSPHSKTLKKETKKQRFSAATEKVALSTQTTMPCSAPRDGRLNVHATNKVQWPGNGASSFSRGEKIHDARSMYVNSLGGQGLLRATGRACVGPARLQQTNLQLQLRQTQIQETREWERGQD